DHDHIGARIVRADLVALGAQLGQDPLGVHQRLGATQADKSDSGGSTHENLSGPCARSGCQTTYFSESVLKSLKTLPPPLRARFTHAFAIGPDARGRPCRARRPRRTIALG